MSAFENTKPPITLIIPVYNVAPYLRQSLDSALAQTWEALSILVVDDGSTDESGAICDEYAARDPRVTVFHTGNRGLAAARNYGLDHMDPETAFVAFLDSDDWMEPDTLRKLADAITEHGADIACCPYLREGGGSPSASADQLVVLEGEQVLRAFLREGFIGVVAWNKLYRADLFAQLRYPAGRVFEDIAVMYRIMEQTRRLVFIPERLLHYRVRESSVSRQQSAKFLVDYWLSCSEQYAALYERVDELCRRSLVGDCMIAIKRMWCGYGGFSKEEKAAADPVLREMTAFTAEHRQAVLRGSYSKSEKLTCLFAASRSPLLMWSLNKAFRVYRSFPGNRGFD